jgi:hypothetical protein
MFLYATDAHAAPCASAVQCRSLTLSRLPASFLLHTTRRLIRIRALPQGEPLPPEMSIKLPVQLCTTIRYLCR